jgi:hypothetical protein
MPFSEPIRDMTLGEIGPRGLAGRAEWPQAFIPGRRAVIDVTPRLRSVRGMGGAPGDRGPLLVYGKHNAIRPKTASSSGAVSWTWKVGTRRVTASEHPTAPRTPERPPPRVVAALADGYGGRFAAFVPAISTGPRAPSVPRNRGRVGQS